MGNVKLHRQFLQDLVSSGDSQLPNRVLKKVFTEGGDFRTDRDDHQYRGIDHAWIRVVSRGNSAYRVIYLREGDEVTLYRAGPHSVEDNLAGPKHNDEYSDISRRVVSDALRAVGDGAATQDLARSRTSVRRDGSSRFLKNHENQRLFEKISGRRLLPHREVVLVSPSISLDLLRSTQLLGQMLDEWAQQNCSITLITTPPALAELPEFSQLERRGFSVLYVPQLHAKAYVFRLDRKKLNEFQLSSDDLLLIGSANLTYSGLNPAGASNQDPQLELSYEVEDPDKEIEDFLSLLAGISVSHEVVRSNLSSVGMGK